MRAMNGYAWHTYHGSAAGTRISGDPNVPSTNPWFAKFLPWYAWALRRFLWKKVVVLQPQIPASTAYRIGFRTHDGQAFIMDRMVTDAMFAMRVGREDCTCFALHKTDGQEVPLRVVATTRLDENKYHDTPLY